jgi:hypothetical protein
MSNTSKAFEKWWQKKSTIVRCYEPMSIAWKAWREGREELLGEPVRLEYRWYDGNPNTVTFGQWYPWEECNQDKYEQIEAYIVFGYSYQVRKLYAAEES